MAREMKKGVKYALYGIFAALIAAALYFFVMKASKKVGESADVEKFQLADMAESASLTSKEDFLPLPKMDDHVNKGTQATMQVFAWNGNAAWMYANGGSKTSEGSLLAAAGWNVEIRRQDDCFVTIADLIKNCKEIKENPNAVPLFCSFMGDGVPGFSVMLKELEAEVGKDYMPRVIYFTGRSNGEDGFWGPAEWRADPKKAKGKAVAGVERDGDINIVIKWCSDNNIRINAQTKYYDPEALNIIPTTTFVEAGEKYISGYTEKRVLIRNGKTVPDSVMTVTCDAYTSWTPVDVTVAEKKGGVVRLASTAEYTSQMPTAVLVCRKWANDHRSEVEALIAALGQAGDQIRSFPEALDFASKVSAVVYKEQDAAYWTKYYKGIETKDVTGMKVSLGGSMAFNLADAANMFGLGDDHKDRYKVTYETFAKILEDLYPKEMKGWIAYTDMVDKSFIMGVVSNHPELLKGKALKKQYAASITKEVSNKTYSIDFELGSANIKPSSYRYLDEIYASATIAEGLKLGIYGHTDALGDDAANQSLSERRAQSIASYLREKGVDADQMEVQGYGEGKPVYGSPEDPRNRCVEIVLGQ